MKCLILIGTLCLCLLQSLYASTPANLYEAKRALKTYHDSGDYQRDIEKVVAEAKAYATQKILNNIKSPHPKNLAVVFDIDETVLSNYADMKRMDFGGSERAVIAAEHLAHDQRIQSTFELYQWLKRHHVHIFFVTGRTEHERKITVKNLKHEGFSGWQALYLKPDDYKQPSVIPYKSSIRQLIEYAGYEIIFSMGDQQSDLDGGHADTTFKLPNPFYFLA